MEKRIEYPRNYRKVEPPGLKGTLYFITVTVIPLFLLFGFIDRWSRFFAEFGAKVLAGYYGGEKILIDYMIIPKIGNVYYVRVLENMKDMPYLQWHMLLLIAIFLFSVTGKRKGRPVFMFTAFQTIGGMVNCLYFMVKKGEFPYTVFDFSTMYIQIQLGIWVALIILYGITSMTSGRQGYGYKYGAFFGIALYSTIFGVIRYILFLYTLAGGTTYYMYYMFFTFGPLFDFIYFVEFYGLLLNSLTKYYGSNKRKGIWTWF